MKRRLVAACLAAALASASGARAASAAEADAARDPSIEPLAVTEVAPGVFVHVGQVDDWLPRNGGDVANLGFVVGARCVAVIDTGGTPAIGRRWRATVERTTPLPVCYVINSHAHPDHVLGDAAFTGPRTQFVAAARYGPALAAREPFFVNALKRDFGITMDPASIGAPALAVDGTRELDLGGRVLQLRAWPTAHTDNDLTVFDTASRTLFTGDLLFARHLPVVDGNLRGWLAVMTDLASVDAARAVPGHGPASMAWPAALAPQRAYLEGLARSVRAAIKAREPLAQAVATIAPPAEGAEGWQLVEAFHRRNVTAAYAELEWED